MDDLTRFILDRIRSRLHPYMPPDYGWRRYPQHVASLLTYLEPLHVIVVDPTGVGVDGVFMEDSRGQREKYEEVIEIVRIIFGETEDEASGGNLVVRRLNTGFTCFSLFWGSVWYTVVCTDLRPYPSRFAYVSDSYTSFSPMRPRERGGMISCVAATVDGAKVNFYVSQEFFLHPKPKNALLFGDLLFLAQAGGGWSVDRSVNVDYSCSDYLVDGSAYLAHVLMECDGLESFVKHAYEELLLRDNDDRNAVGWRTIVRVLEKKRKARLPRLVCNENPP